MRKYGSVSKRQSSFLGACLKVYRLEELLPLYTAAVSDDHNTFETLPEDLVDPIIEILNEFQNFLGLEKEESQAPFDEQRVVRSLRNLNGEQLLSLYVDSISKGARTYEDAPEDLRTKATWWLDELKRCTTGANGLFSKNFNPEIYVDGFVKFAGGRRITEILGTDISTETANYFFEKENLIAELKTLETDFLESNKEKLETARREALKTVKITPGMILGTERDQPIESFWAEF